MYRVPQIVHSEGVKHSTRSPSGAHRWRRCPGSVEAESYHPEDSTPNIPAEEGTAAHHLLEVCWNDALREGLDNATPTRYLWDAIEVQSRWYEIDFEMCDAITLVLDFCRKWAKRGAVIRSEVRSEIARAALGVHDEPISGTADIVGLYKNLLIIGDLKYGVGVPVYVENNEQLILYALGVLANLPEDQRESIEEVLLVIWQPRCFEVPNQQEWKISVDELWDWVPVFQDALVASKSRNPVRIPGEKQCQWCRAAPTCVELAVFTNEKLATVFEAEVGYMDDPDFDIKKVPRVPLHVLEETAFYAGLIRLWLNRVEEELRLNLMNGNELTRFELEKKFGRRTWSNDAIAAAELLALGVPRHVIYKERPMRTPNQILDWVKRESDIDMGRVLELTVRDQKDFKLVSKPSKR